jgi:hypothetical protein
MLMLELKHSSFEGLYRVIFSTLYLANYAQVSGKAKKSYSIFWIYPVNGRKSSKFSNYLIRSKMMKSPL